MTKRLFFTKFGWDNLDESDLKRSLKLFSLINNELIIPSNHIYEGRTESLFRSNPEILELKLVKPAMDTQYASFSDYFNRRDREKKAGRSLSSYGRYLDSLSVETVPYSDTQPAGIFTELAIEQFSNPDSVLARAAGYASDQAIEFVSRLEDIKERSNGIVYFEEFIDASKACFDKEQQRVIQNFADLNRLIAGASSKNCNNLLPQENLIDWCLANPEDPTSFILNDEIIFWEVFIESLIKITEGIYSLSDIEKLSPKLFDKFSFEDIHEIKNYFLQRNLFIERYASILDGVNGATQIGTGRLDLLKYEELIQIKWEITKSFEDLLRDEASLYKQIEITESLLKIAYQILGGTIQTIESVVSFFSITLGKQKNWNDFMQKQQNRIERALKFARNRFTGQPVLIEHMEYLTKKARESWYK